LKHLTPLTATGARAEIETAAEPMRIEGFLMGIQQYAHKLPMPDKR
jgi:hypothetical protein